MALHVSEQSPEPQPSNQQKRRHRKAHSRRKSVAAKRHTGVARRSLTIDEWCVAHGLSRSSYEKLKRAGRGPRELREGRIVRITAAADKAWVAKREAKAAAE